MGRQMAVGWDKERQKIYFLFHLAAPQIHHKVTAKVLLLRPTIVEAVTKHELNLFVLCVLIHSVFQSHHWSFLNYREDACLSFRYRFFNC